MQRPRLGKPRCGLQIFDTLVDFPVPMVVDSISLDPIQVVDSIKSSLFQDDIVSNLTDYTSNEPFLFTYIFAGILLTCTPSSVVCLKRSIASWSPTDSAMIAWPIQQAT